MNVLLLYSSRPPDASRGSYCAEARAIPDVSWGCFFFLFSGPLSMLFFRFRLTARHLQKSLPAFHRRCRRSKVPAATALPGCRPKRKYVLPKAVSPEFDRIDAARLAATDRGQRLPASQTKNNPHSPSIVGSTALTATHSFQFTSLRRTQSERC